MTDDSIYVERAQKGDAAAFRELVERYKKPIYFLALDLTGNQHDAEDLSQEVFIKAYRYMKGFRGDAKFSSWLYRITVNTNIDLSRRKSAKAMKQSEAFDETYSKHNMSMTALEPSPDQITESSLLQNHIQNALQKLTDKERSVFVLKHYKQLKLHEIAEIQKITVGTVKSTLFRAIQRLQKELAFIKADFGLENSHE